MRFYLDADVSLKIIPVLRAAGHDVLSALGAGMAHQGIPDHEQLAFAIADGRVMLTMNRDDYRRLHQRGGTHSGIIICSRNVGRQRLAAAILEAIEARPSLSNTLLRVNAGGSANGKTRRPLAEPSSAR